MTKSWEVNYTDEFGEWWQDQTGDDRWYERMIPMAEKICQDYLAELMEDGK